MMRYPAVKEFRRYL